MMKTILRAVTAGLVALALPNVVHATGAAAARQATAQVSVADATPFVGDWTLALQGPNGPGTFALSISVEKQQVSAEIASDAVAKQPISTIYLVDKSLVLGYSFLYECNTVNAVVSLTPDKDGKTSAQIDFAGGAYVMTGSATKNDKEKGK